MKILKVPFYLVLFVAVTAYANIVVTKPPGTSLFTKKIPFRIACQAHPDAYREFLEDYAAGRKGVKPALFTQARRQDFLIRQTKLKEKLRATSPKPFENPTGAPPAFPNHRAHFGRG